MDNVLRGVVFSDVALLGNKRCGFSMAPYALRTSGVPIDVTINRMTIRDVPGTAYNWGRPLDHNVGGSKHTRNLPLLVIYGPIFQVHLVVA